MIIKRPLSERSIIEHLNIYYRIEVASLTPLLLGADMNASVYKALGHDQKSYFVKLKGGHNHDVGVAILDLLHNQGIQQIIPPIKTVQGQSTQHIDGYTLIVYAYIENQNGFNQVLTNDQWIILGKVLRKVHEFKIPATIQDKVRREDYSPKWRVIVRSLYDHIEINPNKDHWAKKLAMFMKEHKKEIYRLLDSAELLGQKMQLNSAEFVLCHADIHGGNVLIGENGFIYIVDWDQPIMAPKERDLMFIGGGVANVWNNPQEEEFFYEGYGKTEINMPILAYYRQERIIEDIAEYAQKFLFKTTEEDMSEMYQQFIAMFQSNGVVDIAFRTTF
jgi:spectinomycin phosphotransferase